MKYECRRWDALPRSLRAPKRLVRPYLKPIPMNWTQTLLRSALVLSAAASTRLAAQAADTDESLRQVRHLATQAIVVDDALIGSGSLPLSIGRDMIVAPRSDLPVTRAWSVTRAFSHAKTYLLAECQGRVVPLAGFPQPDLVAAAPCVTTDSTGPGSFRDLAMRYARLLARDASAEVFASNWVTGTADSRALRAWEQRRPADWPTDRVSEAAGGVTIVQMTTFTRIMLTPGTLVWEPRAYTFVFTDGRLTAWGQRPGPPLPYTHPHRGDAGDP